MIQLVECRSRTADKLVVLAECKPRPADKLDGLAERKSRVADKINGLAERDSRVADKIFWELLVAELTAPLKVLIGLLKLRELLPHENEPHLMTILYSD